MLTTIGIGAGIVAFNYAAIRYNVGGAAFKAFDTLDGYRKAAVNALSNKVRAQFEDMRVTKEIEEGNTVFNFKKVPIIDFKEIDRQIEEGVKELAISEEGPPSAEGADKAKAEATTAEKVAPKDVKSEQTYEVKLIVKNPNAHLGEVDYSDWEKTKILKSKSFLKAKKFPKAARNIKGS